MSGDKAKVVRLDARRRVLLGKLAEHDQYMASVDKRGVITLTPLKLVPAEPVPCGHTGEP